MRRTFLFALAIGGAAGCSLVLDEPLAFVVGDDAAPPVADMRPLDAVPKDAYIPRDVAAPDAEPDAAVNDARPPDARVDAAPPDALADAAPPDAAPDAAPCVPEPEVCDGRDNDCDEAVDEDDPRLCQRCGVAGADGLCAIGAWICQAGELRCPSWLPDEGTAVDCDLLDNDCDGSVDEPGEVVPPRNREQQAVVDICGARGDAVAPPPIDDCSFAPRIVGCVPAHACVDGDCRAACAEAARDALAQCEDACPSDDPLEAADCLGRCRDDSASDNRACLAECAAVDGEADRWLCENGDGGAVCMAQACPDGLRPEGPRCVPNVEICNNGRDDDGDGLTDGTLAGDDPCAVRVDQRGAPRLQGACSDPEIPGCEDTARMTPSGSPGDALCGADCPRRVDLGYAFAVDTEEVSVRAYAECVAAGCCLPPSGRVFERALAAIAQGSARPDAPDGCAGAVDLDTPDQAPQIPDLPITGVTWCQARDFCSWAGKRLPTEYEWERLATGADERHPYPWGDAAPAACQETQCCRAADYAGDVPGVCDGGLPVCPVDPPESTRLACTGVYNQDDPACDALLKGPAPVYAAADGQTPEGARNLGGNVSEWVFDWYGQSYAGLSAEDPVGQGCDNTPFPGKRVTRGGGFSSDPEHVTGLRRDPFFPSTRLPFIGFRCARTLTDDGARCRPNVPDVPAACAAGADVRAGREPPPAPDCPGPDFLAPTDGDLAACGPAPARRDTVTCAEGLERFCATDEVAGCGSFLVSRLSLPPGLVGGSPEVAGLFNSVFGSALAPRGGATLLALSVPEAFDLVSHEWNARFGSAEINADGQLVWLGIEDGGVCGRTDVATFRIHTAQGDRDLRPVCRAISRGQIWLREAPVSLAFGALALTGSYDPATDRVSGTLILVAAMDDLTRATFGDPDMPGGQAGLDDVFERAGVHAFPLCNLPLGPACIHEPLVFPGCNQRGECEAPQTCTGFVIPLDFEAIRANRSGVLGLDACNL